MKLRKAIGLRVPRGQCAKTLDPEMALLGDDRTCETEAWRWGIIMANRGLTFHAQSPGLDPSTN